MVKRILLLILAMILLMTTAALPELAWSTETPAQRQLKAYIESANEYLTEKGEMPVNSLFEIYPLLAVLGITEKPNAETPEEVEITVTMLYERIDQLQLRVSDPDRFAVIAACLIRALYGENISEEEAMSIPADRAETARKAPKNSFEEEIETQTGSIPRFYYAYYPDQYHDGKNWMQMTIIFPKDAEWSGKEMIIGTTEEKGVDPGSGVSEDYEGYYSKDDFTHYEIFVTPTPEPDSAAAEYDFR